VDAVKQAVTAAVSFLNPTDFKLGSARTLDSAGFRNLCFYRAGMTAEEMTAIHSGTLLQSSLEIYAPLEGTGAVTAASIANHAQSKNVLVSEPGPVSVIGKPKRNGVVESGDAVRMESFSDGVRIYDLSGRWVRTVSLR
jgi:hypothetical protein